MGGRFKRSARTPRPRASVVIWHNPRCSKSRQTLALLREHGIEPTIREYLTDPPSADEIGWVVERLIMDPRRLVRTKEAPYRELGLGRADKWPHDIIAAMARHPILIERPVVICGEKVALGRPPENVLKVLG